MNSTSVSAGSRRTTFMSHLKNSANSVLPIASIVLLMSAHTAHAAIAESVQSGTATSTGNGIVTVTTTTSFDPSKTFLIFQTRSSAVVPGVGIRGRIPIACANPCSTLEFERATSETSTVNIAWSIVTFASGVSVQRGEVAQNAATINVTIASVGTTAQAFVTWSKTAVAGDATWDGNDPTVGVLTSATNLQFRADTAPANHTISWQVIQWTNAAEINVQTGTSSMGTGALTAAATIPTPVTLEKTFVLASLRSAASGVTAGIGAMMIRAELTNSNTITFTRGTVGSPGVAITEIVWQAIELKDNSAVLKPFAAADMNIAEGAVTKTVTLQQEVDPSRSIALGAVQGGGGQNMGSSLFDGADADLDAVGVATATTQLTTSNTLTITRNYTNATLADVANIGWFVVQFDRGPGYGVKVGSFTKPVTTGTYTQVIAHGLGETPKALIVWSNGRSGYTEAFSSWHLFSFGVTDGTTSRSINTDVADAALTQNSARRMSTKLISMIDATDTNTCPSTFCDEATVASWNGSHITLNWTALQANQWTFHYIVIGGSSVQAAVLPWTTPTTGTCPSPPCTKNVTFSSNGFQPDVVFNVHGGDSYTGALDTTFANAAFGLGVMAASGDEWALDFLSVDAGATTMDTQRSQRSSDDGGTRSSFRAITAALGVAKNAKFLSMNAYTGANTGGFSLTFDTVASANASQAFSLLIKGVTVDVASLTKPSPSGGGPPYTVDQPLTVGFQPAAVMLASTMIDVQANPQANARIGVGAGDGYNEGGVASGDTDAVGTSQVDSVDKTSKMFVKYNQTGAVAPTTVDAEATLYDISDTGYTLRWTLNSVDTAPIGTQVLALVFGLVSPGSITAVEVTDLKATRYDDRVLVNWKTGYEVNNLGFNVYREVNGERTRITRSLVAGSGLMTGQGTATRGEQQYAFWDLDPRSSDPSAAYWIEDVDFKSGTKLHGPVTPVDGGLHAVPEIAPTTALRDLGKQLRRRGKVFSSAGARLDGGPKTQPRAARTNTGALPLEIQTQRALAAQGGVKIGIKQSGWYRVTQPELAAAGLDPQFDPQTLRLFVDGSEQAMAVTGASDRRFDPTDAIEFYGTGTDTPYTDSRVYWLVGGGRGGQRVTLHGAPAKAGSTNPGASFPFTVQQKERSIYFAALRNGDAENWFGAFISEEPTDVTVDVSNIQPGAAAQIEVTLQGVTSTQEIDPDHLVGIMVNGSEVGQLLFDGQSKGIQTFAIPAGVLVDGPNTVTLVARNGEADYSLVDVIRIHYPHVYRADADLLRFTADGPGEVTVAGFASSGVRVMDVTDASAVQELRGTVVSQSGLFSVTVRVPNQGTRTLLAFTDATMVAPAFVRPNVASQWSSAVNGADYVAITHGTFTDSIAPLLQRRAQRGLSIARVEIDDIYDEFSFGEKTPQAMKDFVTLARTQWKKAPKFLLLVGDATIDPRDYAGFGDADFVPTKQIPMAQIALETASDDWFADTDEDGLPELAIGRLPVRNVEQAQTMVAKMLAYEDSDGTGWTRNVLLVADQNDGTSDFEASVNTLSRLVPVGYTVQRLFAGQVGGEMAGAQLVDAVNRDGQLIVNYVGHGSIRLWGTEGTLLTSDTVPATWQNAARLPFVVAMNCLNGFFHGIYEEESLAETLVRTADGGAVAAWASSGLTDSATQAVVNQELFRLLFSGSPMTLGQAAAVAKRAITSPDVRRSWIFFGDPALKLKARQ
jgi:hypothetical protein